jgi:hypothetical protein
VVRKGQRDGDRLHFDIETTGTAFHWDPALGVLGALDVLLLADVP